MSDVSMAAPDSLVHPDQIAELCSIAEQTPDGCFVEVGVYKGGTAWHLALVAERQGRALHLFDTFSGMPFKDAIDAHNVGDFGDCSLADVQSAIPSAICHPGIFPNTLVPTGPIAFVHVDCDQYRSVKACIGELWCRMPPGAVMMFDDYSCTPGATKAVDEVFMAERLVFTATGKAYVRKL